MTLWIILFFLLHPKHCNFFSFGQSLKLYTYYLSQYQLVKVLEFLIHWVTHLDQFLSQNITLLINFDLTPMQNCRRAYLTICRSLYYKHNFAVVSSACALTFSTNIDAAELVKYTENILCQVWIKDNVPNKIGGGHHRNSGEKIEMESVRPYIESAPLNYSDFKTCEFVEHLEMSEALIKYNTSIYMMCNIPLHLLVDCLFHPSRVSIGHQHGMLILKE